ncbi:hypothetical protein I8Y06_003313 [Photobacterium damselae]|nr:hypothetical protein [Photobacterium damselae]
MKSFFHKVKFSDICEPLAGILFIPLVLLIIYWIAFCMPVDNISRYKKIVIELNSPEYNSKLIEFNDDGKITLYEQLELKSLQSKIQDEQFVSQLKKTIK